MVDTVVVQFEGYKIVSKYLKESSFLCNVISIFVQELNFERRIFLFVRSGSDMHF